MLSPKSKEMKRKTKTVRLLANFFRDEYYGAYKEMIRQLLPLLENPDVQPSRISRLDFRTDLNRGDKKRIYMAIARLLQSGFVMFRPDYCKRDLCRWLAQHSNLGCTARTIERKIEEHAIRDD